MTQAYTPGLKLARRIRHRVCRRLPMLGEVLVQVGQQVQAQQVVARTWLPGEVTVVNAAHRLGVDPADVPRLMEVQMGQTVQAGQLLAQTKGLFGLFRSQLLAPTAGTVESISGVTGQVILRGPPQPIELLAYLAGRVTEVLPGEGVWIEAEVALVQGIFGVGGEAYGPIRLACQRPDQALTPDCLDSSMHGAVVIGGGRVSVQTLQQARQLGISAIVTGGIDDEDLRQFLGYDLGVAITGSESLGLTLILTEGFGDIAMQERTWQLLASHEGRLASVNGATQIRAGVIRPEVVIPLQQPEEWPDSSSARDPVPISQAIVQLAPADGQIGQTNGSTLPETERLAMSGVSDSGTGRTYAVLSAHAASEADADSLPVGSDRSWPTLQVGSLVRIIRTPYFGLVGRVTDLPATPQVLPSGVKARVAEVQLPDGQRLIVPRANLEWIEED